MMSILLTGIGNSVVFPMFLGLLVLTLANGRNVGYTNEKLAVLRCLCFANYRLRNRRFLVRIQMGVFEKTLCFCWRIANPSDSNGKQNQ